MRLLYVSTSLGVSPAVPGGTLNSYWKVAAPVRSSAFNSSGVSIRAPLNVAGLRSRVVAMPIAG